ncbi:LamG-like jellyroll fold domain-containing protein [Glycomyces sp. MUSA5-2]|uniref:LamG-like jellyroll fold domain-containing protein n=1 Tax=Glycomyces sp. MUSA5-2 TaxID=2053002 RepID=UPI00300AF883
MHLPPRVWRIAGTGLLTLALTAGLATWPWNQTDIPPAEAQEETTSTDGVADTEAEALAEAEASGESVEVLGLRSATHDVVANPDGTFTATEYTLPVRTIVEGEWVDIDPTLEAGSDGLIRPAAATIDLAFSGGGDEPLVTVAQNDHTMTLDWAGSLPEPVLEGDTAVYAEVLPDVDLHVTALEDGFTHTLVVKTAEAAANPELEAIEWPISVDGAEVSTRAEGGLQIVDATTKDLWIEADSPIMWDSTGVAEAFETDPSLAEADPADTGLAAEVAEQTGQQAPVEATADTDSINLLPDDSLLTGSDTVYPVYIDPVFRSASRTAWTMVASAYPSEEYWGWTGDQGVGNCSAWSVSGALCEKKRLFFRIPTSAYSGKRIIEATFAATLRHNYSGENKAHYANLYKTGGISSSTNWNNQPSGSLIATANTPAPSGGDCAYSADHATEWDVRSTVAAAAAAGTSTLTFGIRNDNESDSTYWMRFCNNGHLRVTYNTVPTQPAMSDLRSSAGSCAWTIGADSYTPVRPRVFAVVKDPDGEQVQAQFRFLNTSNSTLFTWTSSKVASGSEVNLNTASVSGFPALASGTEIRWDVRVYDGEAWSPWSSTNSSHCRFIYDTSRPAAPTVTSTDLPEGEVPNPMVGETGTLTIDSAASDVVSYTVKFNEAGVADQTYTAASLSAPVTVEFQPMRQGRFTFDVLANDAAGWSSTTSYSFLATATAAAGSWPLDDPAGSATAADAAGTNPGTAGAGVVFGADGPGDDLAAAFNGTASAFIATDQYQVAPTGESVAIAARVKVGNLSKSGVVASIDGGLGEAGMILGYRSISAAGGQWYVSMPGTAMGAFAAWEVQGGEVNANTQDDWVQLVGVWNDVTGQITLYVDGTVAATGLRESAWWGDGTVQIGRAMYGGAWGGNFTGHVADVHVFDRAVTPDEALDLGFQAAVRSGYWQFTVAPDGTSPAFGTGLPANLEEDARIATWDDSFPLNGDGSLALDGMGDYAWVDAPMADTGKSFSLTARARLDTEIPDQSMTVLSIPGTLIESPATQAAAIEVGYVFECDGDATTVEGCWQLRMTKTGPDGQSVVTQSLDSRMSPSADYSGQSIAVTYDAITGQARLYVNGTDSGLALTGLSASAWSADGDLQIGRGFGATTDTSGAAVSGYRQYFSGLVDEVRTYGGVLTATQVVQLNQAYTEVPEL